MVMRRLTFEAIGTKWTIDAFSEVTDATWRRLQAEIAERIEVFDKTYSRFRADSWVTRISKRAGEYELPPDGLPLLEFYEQLYRVTGGHITPLIGSVMRDAGYDANYSLTSKVLHKPPKWEEAISYAKYSLNMKRAALLDFGAAGKGYLIDIVAELIEHAGLTDYVVNAGGDMLHHSSSAHSVPVGMENPFDTGEVVGIVQLTNKSLCASAGNRRAWGKYHHLISPLTLQSPHDTAATWVIADTAMLADGLATALFFVPPKTLQKQFRFAYARLGADMQLEHSHNFEAELFTINP